MMMLKKLVIKFKEEKMKPKNILVTGGAGYCGSILVPLLLNLGYKVLVFDLLYYGYNHLPTEHKNLKIVKGDIRDTNKLKEAMINIDTVIHLACISNDVSFELDEALLQVLIIMHLNH